MPPSAAFICPAAFAEAVNIHSLLVSATHSLSPTVLLQPGELIPCFVSHIPHRSVSPRGLLIARGFWGIWGPAGCLSGRLGGSPPQPSAPGVKGSCQLGQEGKTHRGKSASYRLVTTDRRTQDRHPALRGYSHKNRLFLFAHGTT